MTRLIVLYKLREKVIPGIIYPKISRNKDGFHFDFGDDSHVDYSRSKAKGLKN